MARPLWQIANEIRKDWQNMPLCAEVYAKPMQTLSTVHDNYGLDSGLSIVSYFLANAGTWRGETARRVKAELKALIKAERPKRG